VPWVKLVLSYDGTRYVGWQVQPNGPSIQAELERALATLHKEPVRITGGVRYGPVTFWLMEDFTLGSVPGLGPRWFYDSNAPDVAIGLTLTLEH
jgi:hypothetical protein